MYIFQQVYIKYKTPTYHWVGHLLMKPIEVDKLFKIRVIISELETSLNDDDSIDVSGIKEGKTET